MEVPAQYEAIKAKLGYRPHVIPFGVAPALEGVSVLPPSYDEREGHVSK